MASVFYTRRDPSTVDLEAAYIRFLGLHVSRSHAWRWRCLPPGGGCRTARPEGAPASESHIELLLRRSSFHRSMRAHLTL